MKDNDIIKALKLCTSEDLGCKRCPYVSGGGCISEDNKNILLKDALDLINRQKAEIERLKTAYETLKQEYDSMFSANRNLMAEVERLRDEVKEKTETIDFLKEQVVDWNNDYCKLKMQLKTAKSEAIKEFAEKVYRFLCNAKNWRILKVSWLINGECDWLKSNINNLVKEMTERKDKKQ